jgi:hypothetical protein
MGAALAAQSFPHNGAAITYTTSGSGTPLATTNNTFPCGQGLALLVKNGSGGTLTVNFTVPAGITVDGLPLTTPYAPTIATGADAIYPLPAARYQDPVSGLGTVGFSTVTSVSAAVISTN